MSVQTVINSTAINSALKELYAGSSLTELGYKNNPFFAMLTKNTDFVGSLKAIPVVSSPAGGISSSFVAAQANEASPDVFRFALTSCKLGYGVSILDTETMLQSATDMGSFVKGTKLAVDTTMRGVMNKICLDLFRSGTGSLAQIGSISSGVITLANASDVVGFERNMVVQAAATDGGSCRAAKGWVVAVDRSLGKVTVATSLGGSAASPSGWQATDFLGRDGDMANGGANVVATGLLGWLPTTAPSSTAFFGLDRSVDSTRLAGVRYDGSAQSIEEALVDAMSLVQREGGSPDVIFMNPASFAALAKSLGTRIIYDDAEIGEFSFKGLQLATPAGVVKVYQDRSCPAKTAFALQMDTWSLESRGPAPYLQEVWGAQGGGFLRQSAADAGELRIAGYGNLACSAPGWNAVIQLGA
jgi:hypothetical protein